MISKVSRKRHLAKTLTWRVLATADTILLGWFITGSLSYGFKIGGFEVLTKMFLYYGHERIWYKFGFGVGEDPEANRRDDASSKVLQWDKSLEQAEKRPSFDESKEAS